MRVASAIFVCLALAACSNGFYSRPSQVAGAPILAGSVPNPTFTPGTLCTADNSNFKEYRYAEHVPYCNRNVTQQMKEQIGASYGIAKADWPNYEFDHYIPLGIGGSSDIANLWPQPKTEALEKDKLEEKVFEGMNTGTLLQADAVAQIRAWRYSSAP